MSEKTLKFRVVSDIKGADALKMVETTLKGIDATVGSISTKEYTDSKGVNKYLHTITADAKTARAALATVGAAKNLKDRTSAEGGGYSQVSAEQTRLQKAQATTAKLTEEFSKRMRIEQAAVKHGVDSIIVFRERQAQKERSIREKLVADLAAIDTRQAQGADARGTGSTRRAAVTRAEREILNLNRQTAAVELRRKNTLEAITALKKLTLAQDRSGVAAARERERLAARTTRTIRGTTQAIRGAAHAQRSWTVQVAEGIGLYRTISFLLAKIKQGIMSIPEAGIAAQSSHMGLVGVFGTEGAEAELEFVKKVSVDYGLQLQSLEKSYVKFANSAILAGASLAEVHQTFEDFSSVGAVLHKTTDEMDSIFLALEQMYAKGVVQSEEVKKQLGNQLPAAIAMTAKAAKLSQAELMKAMKANQLVATKMVPEIAKIYRGAFAPQKVIESLSKQLLFRYNNMINQYTLLNRAFFDKSKAMMGAVVETTGSGLRVLRTNLDGVLDASKLFTVYLLTRTIPALGAYGKAALVASTRTGFLTKAFLGFKLSKRQLAGIRLGLIKASKATAVMVPQVRTAALVMSGLGAATLKASSASLSYGKAAKLSKAEVLGLVAELTAVGVAQGLTAQQADKAARATITSYQTQKDASNNWRITLKEDQVTVWQFMKAGWGLTMTAVSGFLDASWAALKRGAAQNIDWVANKLTWLATQALNAAKAVPAGIAGIYALGKSLISGEGLDIAVGKGAAAVEKMKRVADKAQRGLTEGITTSLKKTRALADALLAPVMAEAKRISQEERKLFLLEKMRAVQLEQETSQKKADAKATALSAKELAMKHLAQKAEVKLLQLRGKLTEAAELNAEINHQTATEAAAKNGLLTDGLKDTLDQIRKITKARAVLLRLDQKSARVLAKISLSETLLETRRKTGQITEVAFSQKRTDLALKREAQLREEIASLAELLKVQKDLNASEAIGVANRKLAKETSLVTSLTSRAGVADRVMSEVPKGFEHVTKPGEVYQDYATTSKDLDASKEAEISLEDIKYEKQKVAAKKNAEALEELKTKHEENLTKIAEEHEEARLKNTLAFAGSSTGLMANSFMEITKANIAMHGEGSKQARASFIAFKAMRIAEISINTAAAAMAAYKNGQEVGGVAGPILGAIQMGVAIATGAVQIAQVATMPMPAAHGGLDNVPKEQTYLLDRGERVLSPNQNRDLTRFLASTKAPESKSSGSPANNVKIVNVIDPSLLGEFLQTDEGEEIIMNIINRNEVA